MSRLPQIISVLSVAALCWCCHRPSAPAVPRRTAYPRIVAYDTVYTAIDSLPLRIMVNSSLSPEVKHLDDGTVWLSVAYPRYDAVLYCTLTPVTSATVDDVVDNRAERIFRNIGGSTHQIIEADNASGFYSNLVLSAATSTPVQFMALDNDHPTWVLSGSVFFGNIGDSAPVDSLMPMIDVIKRDVSYLLDNLSAL